MSEPESTEDAKCIGQMYPHTCKKWCDEDFYRERPALTTHDKQYRKLGPVKFNMQEWCQIPAEEQPSKHLESSSLNSVCVYLCVSRGSLTYHHGHNSN